MTEAGSAVFVSVRSAWGGLTTIDAVALSLPVFGSGVAAVTVAVFDVDDPANPGGTTSVTLTVKDAPAASDGSDAIDSGAAIGAHVGPIDGAQEELRRIERIAHGDGLRVGRPVVRAR